MNQISSTASARSVGGIVTRRVGVFLGEPGFDGLFKIDFVFLLKNDAMVDRVHVDPRESSMG